MLGLSTELDKSKPSVLVAHYTVSGSEADNGSTFLAGQDVVVLPATIDAMGVDLACFGHIHKPQRLVCQTPAFYCGSVNQLTFNDEGTEHGFYIHTIDGQVSSEFAGTPEPGSTSPCACRRRTSPPSSPAEWRRRRTGSLMPLFGSGIPVPPNRTRPSTGQNSKST